MRYFFACAALNAKISWNFQKYENKDDFVVLKNGVNIKYVPEIEDQ